MFHRIITLVFLTILISCGQAQQTQPSDSSIPCSTNNPDRWTTGVSSIFQNYCVTCHQAFSSYTSAKSEANSIASQVNSGSMPRSGTLSSADRQSIIQWAACGSPN